jgi:hypothetical protein
MIAALLAAVLTLAAQDAPPAAAALQAEFDSLKAEYGKYSDEFWKSLTPDADGTLHMTEEQQKKMPDTVYGSRFLELGLRAGKTPAGAQALVMALRTVQGDDARQSQVAERLVTDFLDSPELEQAVQRFGGLRWSLGSAGAEGLLRRVRDGSPLPAVQAAATFELAQVLMDPVYAKDQVGALQTTPRTDTAPARALLEELGTKYKDTRYAAQAAAYLFELDHLQVGMVAPDFEATDQDGTKFKLSDYRGKVVLLDFWGFW